MKIKVLYDNNVKVTLRLRTIRINCGLIETLYFADNNIVWKHVTRYLLICACACVMPMCYENVSVRLTIIISAIERPLLAIGPHRSFVASVRSSLHLYALPATLNRAFVHAVVGCIPTYYASFADQRSPFENFRSRCHLNELIRWIRSVALLVLTKYR